MGLNTVSIWIIVLKLSVSYRFFIIVQNKSFVLLLGYQKIWIVNFISVIKSRLVYCHCYDFLFYNTMGLNSFDNKI